MLDTEECEKLKKCTTGFLCIFSSRNTFLPCDDIVPWKINFEAKLDQLFTELLALGGPFCLGKDFTALNALMIDKDDACVATRNVARRLCIPRDMGSLIRTFFRGALSMALASLK